MGLLETALALGAGAIVKWWSKRKGKKAHKVGSPVAAVLAGAIAHQLGLEVSAQDIQANAELMELLHGGAAAVLLHSLGKGAVDSVKK